MPIRRRFRGVRRDRACRLAGCDQKVAAGKAYCQAHARTPEAVAFRRELQGAGAYLELAAEALDPDQAERAEAFQRFRSRARHGQFDRLLEAPTRRVLDQAAAIEGFKLEIGALRYGLMRVLAEETDPARMALAIARLSNAGVRARQANGDVEADRAADLEADWLDHVSEAMLGITLDGEDFARSTIARRAQIHQMRSADRWADAHKIKVTREEEVAAAEAERRRRVTELFTSMDMPVPVWDTPNPSAPPARAAQPEPQPPPDPPLPPLPIDGEVVWDPTPATPDQVSPQRHDAEARHDAAHARRVVDQRTAALRLWEPEQHITAPPPAPPPPEPRLARGH